MLLLNLIVSFSQSPKFDQRQTFILIAEQFVNNQDVFKEHFYENYRELVKDKVKVVKIILGQSLKRILDDESVTIDKKEFQEIYNKLVEENGDIREIRLLNQVRENSRSSSRQSISLLDQSQDSKQGSVLEEQSGQEQKQVDLLDQTEVKEVAEVKEEIVEDKQESVEQEEPVVEGV